MNEIEDMMKETDNGQMDLTGEEIKLRKLQRLVTKRLKAAEKRNLKLEEEVTFSKKGQKMFLKIKYF